MVEMNSFQEEFQKQASAALQGEGGLAVETIPFVPITDFSTHFAEWAFRETHLVAHLFARHDAEEEWNPDNYSGRLHPQHIKVDPKGGVQRTGLPKINHPKFPDDILERVKTAADEVWKGKVAIDLVPELGAIAVQFQDAKNTVTLLGDKFMDKFCEELDRQLET